MDPRRCVAVGLLVFLAGVAGVNAAGSRELLVEAAKNADARAVEALLKQRVDVNALAADGSTALHWAAHRNDVVTVDLLLKARANINVANRYGVTPLALAAENGNAEIIERFLKAGADPNVAKPGGETPLMIAAQAGQPDAVKMLITHGANVNNQEETRGQTALMWAAARGNVAAIKVLVEGGANLTMRSHGPKPVGDPDKPPPPAIGKFRDYGRRGRIDAFSPLLFAVRAGHIDATKALLDAGADVNDMTEDGASALVLSLINRHYELASVLLDRGADPNAAKVGWNALHQLARSRTLSIGQFPWPQATGTVHSLDLAKKMIAMGANVNARMTIADMKDGYRAGGNRNGATAFWLSAFGGDVEMMRLLAAAGADPMLPNRTGTTPLMLTAGVESGFQNEATYDENAFQALKLMVELGGDVNTPNAGGETPLHGAAKRGYVPILQILLDNGANIDVKNKKDCTPLMVANTTCGYGGDQVGQPHITRVLVKEMTARGIPIPPGLDENGLPPRSKSLLDTLKKVDVQAAPQPAKAEPQPKR